MLTGQSIDDLGQVGINKRLTAGDVKDEWRQPIEGLEPISRGPLPGFVDHRGKAELSHDGAIGASIVAPKGGVPIDVEAVREDGPVIGL
jgi:hypothetical protein